MEPVNFDDILEQRELETSTKSPPKLEDGANLCESIRTLLAMQTYTAAGRQTTSPLNETYLTNKHNNLQIDGSISKKLSSKSKSRSYLRSTTNNKSTTPKDCTNRHTISALSSARGGLNRRGSPNNRSTITLGKNSQSSEHRINNIAKKRTVAQLKKRNTSNASLDSHSVTNRIFSTNKTSNRNCNEDNFKGFGVMEKSHSQVLNSSLNTTYKQKIHQKLF